jgi:hypothetical protein
MTAILAAFVSTTPSPPAKPRSATQREERLKKRKGEVAKLAALADGVRGGGGLGWPNLMTAKKASLVILVQV